ncbi:isoamyl acetate-hydrolyzing esterase 1 homolog isoform X2 [Bufo gargarizans]|uniref:isoamyl acetate-hydrolyzing esterase 1 homolog isoform X2 n=1 Tax=Bufo gargarizans TaxID=30331 RepID=UPI001CF2FE06|nr:isoamyl acetate-hydrolyzing esterase 1 homolog isoform X2 [Bufo gargarizans]
MISYPRVLLFGDSITQFAFETNGWGATLANKLVRKCDVLNRGLSGYNTRWAKQILPKLIPDSAHAADIAAVTIFFGANDSSIREQNPQKHVPLEEYTENLRSMVQYLKSVNIKEEKIVLITPPPIHEPTLEKHCLTNGFKLNRLNAVTWAYARACAKVGDEYGADVVDLWTLMQEGGSDYTVYLSDGLHLSEEGNQFLESKLWPLLEKKLGALPFILPYWNDVDNNNPESSLFQNITEKKD